MILFTLSTKTYFDVLCRWTQCHYNMIKATFSTGRKWVSMKLTRVEHRMSFCLFAQIRFKITLKNSSPCFHDHHLIPAEHHPWEENLPPVLAKACISSSQALWSRACVALPSRGRTAPNTSPDRSAKPVEPGWSCSINPSLQMLVSAPTSGPCLLPGALFCSSSSQWGVSELADLWHTGFGANGRGQRGGCSLSSVMTSWKRTLLTHSYLAGQLQKSNLRRL